MNTKTIQAGTLRDNDGTTMLKLPQGVELKYLTLEKTERNDYGNEAKVHVPRLKDMNPGLGGFFKYRYVHVSFSPEGQKPELLEKLKNEYTWLKARPWVHGWFRLDKLNNAAWARGVFDEVHRQELTKGGKSYHFALEQESREDAARMERERANKKGKEKIFSKSIDPTTLDYRSKKK